MLAGARRRCYKTDMRIGMNTLLWSFDTREEHFPLFGTLKEVGFDGIELQITDDSVAHYKKAGDVIRDLGMTATGVAGVPEGKM